MTDKMGAPDVADTPESRNGHADLAQLASNLRSSFDSRLPPFEAKDKSVPVSASEALSEALKKHHRYTVHVHHLTSFNLSGLHATRQLP